MLAIIPSDTVQQYCPHCADPVFGISNPLMVELVEGDSTFNFQIIITNGVVFGGTAMRQVGLRTTDFTAVGKHSVMVSYV